MAKSLLTPCVFLLIAGLSGLSVSPALAAGDYVDVPADHWARPALASLAQKYGLRFGYPDGSFQGQRTLTRYEMAAVLLQVLEKAGDAPAADAAQLGRLRAEFAHELAALAEKSQAERDALTERLTLAEADSQQRDEDLLGRLSRQLPFRFSGDLALRYEHVAGNLLDTATTLSSTPQSRLTLSLDSLPDSGPLAYGARLTIGNPRNPVNSWWRLGDFFGRVELSLDRFFLSWRPTDFLDLTVGKFRSPYGHSELLFDADVQPEGAFQRLHFEQMADFWPSASLTLAETVINMNPLYQGNIFLLSAEGDTRLQPLPQLSLNLSLGYHHWVGESRLYDANQIAIDNGQPLRFSGNRQTNTSGTEFAILDGFASLSWAFGEHLPLTLAADYLRNLRAEERNQALEASLSLGELGRPGDWKLAYVYKYLEADASVDFLVEDQLGGTDVMAHEGQALLQVFDQTTLFATYQYAQGISMPGTPRHTLRLGVHQSF